MKCYYSANESSVQHQIKEAESQLGFKTVETMRQMYASDWAENYLEALKRKIAFVNETW